MRERHSHDPLSPFLKVGTLAPSHLWLLAPTSVGTLARNDDPVFTRQLLRACPESRLESGMTTTQAHQEQIDEQAVIWEVPDELWERSAPILVVDKPRKKSGRPRVEARPIFNGLIWLARTGSQWSAIPRAYGAKSTVHERFTEWMAHGCLNAAWAALLKEYGEVIGIDWEWQAADGSIIKAPLGKRGLPARRKRPAATQPTEVRLAANAPC